MCSFGDFVAVSHEIDLSTANMLKIEVSDGIIAPGYTPEALEILRAKKKGAFIILQADPSFVPPEKEYRTANGVGFVQKRNDVVFTEAHLTNFKTTIKEFTQQAKLDLIL